MITLTQQYRREIGRCTRLVNILSPENLNEVCLIIHEYLKQLQNLKNRMMKNENHDLDLEVFEANMRAIRALLEYADVFILHDIDRYKKSMLCLLSNFRTFIKKDNQKGMLMNIC